jgi:GMP synthase (glutamine-hydrolysing)
MQIHTLQHVPYEGAGAIGDWAQTHGHSLSTTHIYANDTLPSLESFDWLVVMGGPMNIYQTEEYPWLVEEKAFIKAAIDADKAVIGVCLGSQLIADVLGAPVTRNAHVEIGWFPIQLTPQAASSPLFRDLPTEFPVLHWHGDTFAIPQGATRMAQSAGCANQAFVWNDTVVGLQFHLETSPPVIEEWLEQGDALVPETYIQTGEKILSRRELFEQNNHILFGILDNLAALHAAKLRTSSTR